MTLAINRYVTHQLGMFFCHYWGKGLGSSGAKHVIEVARKGGRSPLLHRVWASLKHHDGPYGYQDEYTSVLGGLHLLRFQGTYPDYVQVTELPHAHELALHLAIHQLRGCHSSVNLLSKHVKRLERNRVFLRQLRDLAYEGAHLLEQGKITALGPLIHEGWELKRKFYVEMEPPEARNLYAHYRKRGATGGKVCGSGGQSTLLLFFKDPNTIPYELERVRPDEEGVTCL